MKETKDKSCTVYKDDKIIIRGQVAAVCKKLFASGIIQMFPDRFFKKADDKRSVEDWDKIVANIDELLEDGYVMMLGE